MLLLPATTYIALAACLMLYCAAVLGTTTLIMRRAYTETHPAHFVGYLRSTTLVAAVGMGMCLGFAAIAPI